jgi:outer membrane biosynthesis protein TonB
MASAFAVSSIIVCGLSLMGGWGARAQTTTTTTPNSLTATNAPVAAYPDRARELGIKATVEVEVLLRGDGSVAGAHATRMRVYGLNSSGEPAERIVGSFKDSAVFAARTWKFEDPSKVLPRSVVITFEFHEGTVSGKFGGLNSEKLP